MSFCEKRAVECGRHRQQEFVGWAQFLSRLENRRQVHPHFFYATARHDRDPGFGGIESVLGSIVLALDGRTGKISQGMADKARIHATFAVELLLKGENHQRFVDVFAQQANPSLAPRPELRTHVIHDGNGALAHLPGDSPIKSRGIDDDGEVRPAMRPLRRSAGGTDPRFSADG